ncbi:MAG: hypothetical protein WBO46_02815 [Caldilineaceae bacterium]
MLPLFPFGQIQEDCQWVLSQVRRAWKIPAETLYEAISLQGWRVCLGPLREGQFCVCDAWNQTLTVSDRLVDELDCPHLQQEVLHWLLAVQLGTIRLHSMDLLEGKNSPALERAGTDYAIAFLLPEETLRAHPDVMYLLAAAPLGKESWRRMCRVAESFRVPVSCVQAALEQYGCVESARFREVAA